MSLFKQLLLLISLVVIFLVLIWSIEPYIHISIKYLLMLLSMILSILIVRKVS